MDRVPIGLREVALVPGDVEAGDARYLRVRGELTEKSRADAVAGYQGKSSPPLVGGIGVHPPFLSLGGAKVIPLRINTAFKCVHSTGRFRGALQTAGSFRRNLTCVDCAIA